MWPSRAGDVVLIRTGHGRLWMKDNAAFAAGEPGIGMDAGQWLCDHKIILVGTDTWATEVVPPEDPDGRFRSISSCSSATASTTSRTRP